MNRKVSPVGAGCGAPPLTPDGDRRRRPAVDISREGNERRNAGDDEGLNLTLEHCARLNSFEPGHAESASSHRSVTGESGLQAR